jgi:TonB family protein
MRNRLAAAFVMLLALTSLTGAQTAADAGLTKGIAQVQDGRWDDAVSTLSDAVKRLSATPARKEDLAQAYLWLGIAYAQLDSEKSGRASFREALKLDPRATLAAGWPSKVSRLYAEAKGQGAPPAAAPGMAPTSDALSPEEKAVYEKYRYHTDGLELDEAEALLRDWMARNPKRARPCVWLAELMFRSFYERPTRFDDGVAVADRCLTLEPKNPEPRQTLANSFWGHVRGPGTDEEKDRYADLGLKYTNLALRINPNLMDSMIMKGLFLRTKAVYSKDEKKGKTYLAEANLLSDKTAELRKSGKGEFSGAEFPDMTPSDAAPIPAFTDGGVTGGVAGGVVGGVISGLPGAPPPPTAVRVGGQIKEPRKLKNVSPAYPPIAQSARVQGVVIIEAVIGPTGRVQDARVLRSIPLLDAAALDAVRQWEFTPTLLNGVPVPVIMTVTVQFTLS